MSNSVEHPVVARRVRSARWNVITSLDWWLALATAALIFCVCLARIPRAEPGWPLRDLLGIRSVVGCMLGLVGFPLYFLGIRWLLLCLKPGWFTEGYCSACGAALRPAEEQCPNCGAALT